MVTRILENVGTPKGALDYNEAKVAKGVASVVMSENLPGDDPFSIYYTMEEYASNPAISEKATNLCFHMAVNPGVEDAIDEPTALLYIKELMERLGFGAQPYVVYRHEDIDRPHYHVVSVTVGKDGRIISDSWRGRKAVRIQREAAKKYGFHSGLPGADMAARLPSPKPMKKGMRNVNLQMRANIAFCVRASGGRQPALTAALSALGLEHRTGIKKTRDGGKEYSSFRAFGLDGTLVTRPQGESKVLGEGFAEFAAKTLAKAARGGAAPRADRDLAALVRRVRSVSDGLADFNVRLRREGVVLSFTDASGKRPGRRDVPAEAWFLDLKTGRMATARECGIGMEELLRMAAASARRRKKRKGEAETPKMKKRLQTQ